MRAVKKFQKTVSQESFKKLYLKRYLMSEIANDSF